MTEVVLESKEPAPDGVYNAEGTSPYFLVCEHAGSRIPNSLNRLGMRAEELKRHIALDIGALEVAKLVADKVDTVLMYQNYSRLVVDCNRRLTYEGLILEVSDHTSIPGNLHLSEKCRSSRIARIWQPFHDAVADRLKKRLDQKRPTLLVCIHSFTPVMEGRQRPWHVGFCYNRDPSMSRAFSKHLLELDPSLRIGLNEPYEVLADEDYTIPEYGEKLGLLHTLVEIRQDLIAESEGWERWAELLANVCRRFQSKLNR